MRKLEHGLLLVTRYCLLLLVWISVKLGKTHRIGSEKRDHFVLLNMRFHPHKTHKAFDLGL